MKAYVWNEVSVTPETKLDELVALVEKYDFIEDLKRAKLSYWQSCVTVARWWFHNLRCDFGFPPAKTGSQAQWFKHPTNFRSTPAALSALRGGERIQLALYKLREVIAENCNEDNGYETELFLQPPTTLHWLAQQILTPTDNDYGIQEPTAKECEELLQNLANAGSVSLTTRTTKEWTDTKTGQPMQYLVVSCPDLTKTLERFGEGQEFLKRKGKKS